MQLLRHAKSNAREPHKCFIDEITHIEEEHPIAIASQSAESHSITMD